MAEVLYLDFFGAVVAVAADNTSWLAGMRSAFPDFVAAAPSSQNAFRLLIEEAADLPAVPDYPLTWEGVVPEGHRGSIHETDHSAFFTVEDKVAVSLSYREGWAELFVKPGSHPDFFISAVVPILDAALSTRNQHLVHSGCVVDEATGRAILICAPSGAGKTTTSMALARRGFALMTDDASVIMSGPNNLRVWAMPRDLKVHRKTLELLPWIGPLPDRWDDNGEQGVSIASLRERISIMPPRPVELGAIVLLGQRSANGHSLMPLSKPEMLIALAHDNVAQRAAGMTIKSRRLFETLADVVPRVPTFLLRAGEALDTLPDIARRALEPWPQRGDAP